MGWLDDADGVIAEAMEAFGEPVSFEPPVVVDPASPSGGRGKFDAAHEAVDIGGEAAVSSSAPVLTVRIADFIMAPTDGTRLTVRGERYEVLDPQPDGQGGLKLVLKTLKRRRG